MNRRQKKKMFKKRFGFNPPNNITIYKAIWIAKHRKIFIEAVERLKRAISDLWESIKQPALQLAEALKEIATAFITAQERQRRQYVALVDFQTKVLLQQRQQEREVKQIESNINIFNHDRR